MAALVIIFGAQLKTVPLPTISALLVFAGVEILGASRFVRYGERASPRARF